MKTQVPDPNRAPVWRRYLAQLQTRVPRAASIVVEGKLTRMVGLTLETVGCQSAIGGRCLVAAPGGASIEAEVVGFSGEKLFLMPTGEIHGLVPNARVIPTGRVCEAQVGMGLLGRVVDGAGKPLDGKGRLRTTSRVPLTGRSINPLSRRAIR